MPVNVMVTCAVIRAVSSLQPRVGPLSRPVKGAILEKLRVNMVSGAAFSANRWRQS